MLESTEKGEKKNVRMKMMELERIGSTEFRKKESVRSKNRMQVIPNSTQRRRNRNEKLNW